MPIAIEAVHADVLTYRADVLALKFAQELYGVDLHVVRQLSRHDPRMRKGLPVIGKTLIVPSADVVPTDAVLFVGVESAAIHGTSRSSSSPCRLPRNTPTGFITESAVQSTPPDSCASAPISRRSPVTC